MARELSAMIFLDLTMQASRQCNYSRLGEANSEQRGENLTGSRQQDPLRGNDTFSTDESFLARVSQKPLQ